MALALPFFLESSRGLALLGLLFWFWMIAECARRERPSWRKVGWLLLVILVPDVGALLYFLLRVARVRG